MDVLLEVEMTNAQYQALGRVESGATTRDRQSPGEQYQSFRRRVSETDNLSITFFPADGGYPHLAPAPRQPNRLHESTLFAIIGAALLVAMTLFLLTGVHPVIALVLLFPALICLHQGRKWVIKLMRMALQQLLR